MKKIIYLSLVSLFVFTSCNQEDETIDVTLKSKKDKVTLCHKGKIITVNGNALQAHLKHGDIQLVDEDGDGWVEMENGCVPGGDCDDSNPLINPGVEEICGNSVDDDCDGDIDEECRTYVPDDKFEEWLIDSGHDDVLDNYVLTSNIQYLTRISINGDASYYIVDYTGIEDFKALEELTLVGMVSLDLDLSKNLNLKKLRIDGHVNFTEIINLNISKNIALEYFELVQSPLNTNLDFSYNINLRTIIILRVDGNGNNYSLDFSNNIALTEVVTQDCNELTNINLRNGTNNILRYNSDRNIDLLCIQVDDLDYSNANWFIIDSPLAFFSENCGL